MKILKKNQLAILVIALMLVTAGYLNYTASYKHNQDLLVSSDEGVIDIAEIGDATLVSSNDVISSNNMEENQDTSTENSENSNISINTSSQTVNTDDYFANSRLERDMMYSQMIDSYTGILENSSISEEQKAISRQEIKKINDIKNAIMISENLIKTKKINECIIFVNDQSISVIVNEEELSQDKVAQIQNIITRELKASIENIHIINKK